MAKTFSCHDAGVNCSWKVRSETEQELMSKVAEHARVAHKMPQIPQELEQKVRASIRDEK
jgi:predicted small metal-binding protein